MTGRGKFCSLTLINWNGFFARTFDLDQLVTTLSGGNGAGKSTTMAAFITALIPDLTLLHFRNTTEAGATSGSRDKGLYGKLRPGVCYAVLDVENSLGQRVLAGVRLQQVAGRDRKVDIKPFSIQDLPASIHPAELLTETVDGRQARVLPLTELKDKFEDSQRVQFRQYNAISDYHALMFDLGMVARRMKTSADRSKYYRLMEASLYGGISSAITRSLRDYLLPENSGVRKAFQDMEAALRENRMTLEAIRVTQSDREMFKHLIFEATSYVAADYMRHANERRQHLDGALQLRQELALTQKQQAAEQERHVEMASELAKHTADEAVLESEYQRASDHLNLVQTAVRQQEKITRYEADLDELRERLEAQSEIAEEARETEFENAARSEAAELEVDELKNQLADYQQALDVQQTRAIQYQQAQHALERARDLCQLPDLNIENAMEWQNAFHQREREATDTLLGLEQKLSMAEAAHSQFEQAFALVCKIGGPVSRSDAWQIGRDLLRDAINQRHRREQLTSLRARLAELEQRLLEQQEAKHLLNQFCTRQGREHDVRELPDVARQLDELAEQLSERVSKATERQLAMGQQREHLSSQLTLLTIRAPQWLMAQELLLQLREQSGMALADSQQMTEYLQHLLEQERGLIVERDNIAVQKREAERQIERLSQPGGAEDSRLNQLADRFGGVLLSEIYDDVTLDDAPWFSALYGPARHAIVVSDLSLIRDQLNELQDCPEDLYLIEGDPQAFDESVFNAEELEGAVVVKVAERQWRYSRFPKVPLFGRAARENQLERLRAERGMLNERFATFSFDVQKTQRLHQSVSRFIGTHITVAFDPDPEAQIRQLKSQRSELERALSQHESENQRERQQYDQVKESTGWLNQLLPRSSLLGDDTLQDRYDEIVTCLEEAQEAAHYLQQHDAQLVALESVISVLQNDPKQHDQLKRDYQLALETQRKTREQAFALAEVVQRRAHLSYQDAAAMLDNTGSLNEQLRRRLEQAEDQRRHAREQLRQHQQNLAQQNQTLASLKSAYDAKEDMYKELLQEMHDIGVKADASAEARARQQRDEIYSGLSHNRARRNQLEKQLTLCEAEIDGLQKKLKRVNRDYLVMREQVVTAKAGWCAVMCLVKEHGMERRLHKRELAYLGSDELRSMSDKALGALRLAVADNEHLRDLLRGSEDAKRPERKIQFFIAVYQHLRERIRQDIIATDDPVDAIEQMEIELSRLTEELTAREQTLAISSHSVANIIRKTIQREQLRIRQLNQGLRSVSFGQVNSVRLNVNVRESHSLLLDVLSQQHEQHQDLFTSNRLTFSEALARLYQRLNPQIDMGQRTPQTIGEALLDYRNYLEMEVEVNRGSDGWFRAESGALSTGEAIGTGMSILVMVVQSWEEESRRLRGKDISPCRLLFLDEAARLDARSINTLFELCERLEMQLIIAAPENISPEKGTTYKLVRKVINNSEHVHVVGLRGFSSEPDDAANTDPLGQLQFESR